jgi:hypothetical protein
VNKSDEAIDFAGAHLSIILHDGQNNMKAIYIALFYALCYLTGIAAPTYQLHYTRALTPEVDLMVIATDTTLSCFTDAEWSEKKKVGIEKEEFLELCTTSMDFITQAFSRDTFTQNDEIQDADARILIFSGSSNYTFSWQFHENKSDAIESLILEHFGATDFTELLKNQSPTRRATQ